jgi:hypothetical protein
MQGGIDALIKYGQPVLAQVDVDLAAGEKTQESVCEQTALPHMPAVRYTYSLYDLLEG